MQEHKTLVEALKHAAFHSREKIYYVEKDMTISKSWSYKELWEKANSIALKLHTLGVQQNENIILLYSPGLEFIAAFFAVLLVGAVPIPTYPPFAQSSLLRLLGITARSKANIVLIDRPVHFLNLKNKLSSNRLLKPLFKFFFKKMIVADDYLSQIKDLKFINTEDISVSGKVAPSLLIQPEDIALVQFTSGSISEPKGVILTHHNLIANIRQMVLLFNLNQGAKIFSWVPQYHDMGLIGCILMGVYTQCSLYMTSPINFIRQPLFWLQSMSKFKITHSCAPNFAYDLCVNRYDQNGVKNLDLSSIKILINGAEPIKISTLTRFFEKFSPYNLSKKTVIPAYGLAEASLLVSSNIQHEPLNIQVDRESFKSNKLILSRNQKNSVPLISCGSILNNLDVQIFDPETHRVLKELEVGEILIAGDSVTQGYLGVPELNQELYVKSIAGKHPAYLRTGDLGFKYKDQLFITGRKKDLIIYYGKNFYPQDIERISEESCSFIRKGCSAAFNLDKKSQIILVSELKQEVNPNLYSSIADQIRKDVLKMLDIPLSQVVLISSASLPKTTSGKIQRQLTKQKFLKHELEILNAQ